MFSPNAVKVETRVKGGYVYANQSTQGQNATYEGPVDTQASINATFLNYDNVRPQLGVAVNLPTGTSYLPNNQRFARTGSRSRRYPELRRRLQHQSDRSAL